MKKTHIIKTLAKGGISLLIIAGTSSALAADQSPTLLKNIPALLKNIAAINYASKITSLQQEYQNDINASAIQQTNNNINAISAISKENKQQLSQLQTQQLLQSFHDLIIPNPTTSNTYSYASESSTSTGISPTLKEELLGPAPFSGAISSNNYQNIMTPLRLASDSAYLPDVNSSANRQSNDAFFNAGSLLDPTTYTPAQRKSAILYENYLINPSRLYQEMPGQAQGQFDAIKNHINTLTLANTPADTDKAKGLISALQNLPSYQKFKFLERSALSSYSLSQNALNSILIERSVPLDSTGKPIASKASPLELEKQRATYRLSSKFQNSMQAASSATVQRQMLSTLAEIEQQLVQQHLDHEKEIALLAKININQTNQTVSMSMSTLQQKLKAKITKLLKKY